MAYSGYGRAAYTPGERRLPAAASNGQWMENAQTCLMLSIVVFLLHQLVTKKPNTLQAASNYKKR